MQTIKLLRVPAHAHPSAGIASMLLDRMFHFSKNVTLARHAKDYSTDKIKMTAGS